MMGYLDPALGPKWPVIVRKVTRVIRQRWPEADCVAVRGLSGALVGAAVAARLKVPLLVVRKSQSSERRHSRRKVEWDTAFDGYHNVALRLHKYVVVDDLVSTGRTIRAIDKALQGWFRGNSEPCRPMERVGIVLWNQRASDRHTVAHKLDCVSFKV